ncbi:stage III sporulation protein AG [Metabacillus sediminilitoris]|jgi:stage III sporulation protein AG|uniref:Stage III sporulation protein AG n=1 Tax=Metabacillus sediminilitoris TaxID=2567941 RepID=A0A4S4BZ35_9BACI|nr:stage III sporulation protein AG [Metabacillus sediminilitoris]QGQ47176.1 stage III sporulation protein AG [Metabacillus sediminilitoris]THF80520.1 stage III sporulation protein AG [Metabacillus sediminilitoris]
MNNKEGFFHKLKSLLGQSDSKKPSKYQYFILVFVLGVAFMLVSNLFSSKDNQTNDIVPTSSSSSNESTEVFKQEKGEKTGSISDYEAEYENQLKEVLETISGVGNVSVVVNVDSTETKVVEKNTVTGSQVTKETDREGGKREVEDQSTDEQVVIIQEGEKEVPIVVQTRKPEIRGVLIVAQGADNIHIKKTIIESVTRVLGVPSHRVAVASKKMKEDE